MAEKIEDLNLPNTVISRLIKEAIDDSVMVGKDARTALARAASVFILYLTSSATNISKKNNRKVMSGQDILDALVEVEFEEFIEPLKKFLETYKESQKQKKNLAGKKKKSVGSEETHDTEEEKEVEEEADTKEDENEDEEES